MRFTRDESAPALFGWRRMCRALEPRSVAFWGMLLLWSAVPATGVWAAGDPALTLVQLSGYPDRAAAQAVARELEAAGIETHLLPFSKQRGFAVSAGVFIRPAHVRNMDQRLRELGHQNVEWVALGPVPTEAESGTEAAAVAEGGGGPGVAPDAPEQAARPVPAQPGGVLELGRRPPPPSIPAPETDREGRIGFDQLRAEAGLLPRSGARADGSHYLHGSVSAEWPIAERWSARLAGRVDGYIQTGDDDYTEVDLDYGDSLRALPGSGSPRDRGRADGALGAGRRAAARPTS
jgi:hypothetical protein